MEIDYWKIRLIGCLILIMGIFLSFINPNFLIIFTFIGIPIAILAPIISGIIELVSETPTNNATTTKSKEESTHK